MFFLANLCDQPPYSFGGFAGNVFAPRGVLYLENSSWGVGDRVNIRIQKHAIMMAQLIAVMKVRQKTHRKKLYQFRYPFRLSTFILESSSYTSAMDIDAWLGSRIVFS